MTTETYAALLAEERARRGLPTRAPEAPRTVPLADLAERLGLSTRTLRYHVAEGRLRAPLARNGGTRSRWVVTEEEARRYAAEYRKHSRTPHRS